MRAGVFVRVASVLGFFHAVLHTIGGVFGKVQTGPAAAAVAAMKANPFEVFGNPRTYWDFYMGLGLGTTTFLTMEAVVLWILAPLAANYEKEVRPALLTFAIGYLVLAANSFRYFFFGPVVVELLMAGCLLASVLVMRGKSTSG